MKQVVVRYKIKPDKIEENNRLIQAMFAELRAKTPAGLRYAAWQLEDGTVVHVTSSEDGATSVSDLEAFTVYQRDIANRLDGKPVVSDATAIGEYP